MGLSVATSLPSAPPFTGHLRIEVPLQPKQVELDRLVENSPYTIIGFGGSRGGSKSHGARAIGLLFCLRHAGVRVLIFRRTFDDLWENHIQPLFDQYPYMRAWYNTQHKELTCPNGSVLKFGYAEHAGDINDFQGKQYALILVDEATKLTQEEIEFLLTCNRWDKDPTITPKMVLTMNPGGVGHAFIKRVFIDKKYHGAERPNEYAFLQAYGWDNSGWARRALLEDGLTDKDYYSWTDAQRFEYFISRTDYGRRLNALPGKLRIGHLMGRWDVFAGQYFDIWEPEKHTARVESLGIRDWWPKWISIDWGFEHNTAAHWHTLGNSRKATYREFLTNHEPPESLARKIAEKCKNGGTKPEVIDAIYLSPDAFAKRTSEETIAEQMGRVFREHGLPYPTPADNDRIGGWQLMYESLGNGTWVIADNCTALCENLPTLTRDEDKVEDVEKVNGDDPSDSARYGLKSRQFPNQPPLEERVMKHVTSEDPSMRMLQIQAALGKEKQKEVGPVKRRPWMARRWARN